MIDYRLDDLGWFEFEQLIQALTKSRLGFGIEAWGGHGDLGRDAYFKGKLRYPTKDEADGVFVFQAKFVEGANAAGAKPEKLITSSVQKECAKIQKNLNDGTWEEAPVCYALFTNASIPHNLHDTLCTKIKTALPTAQCAIHDGNDICQWLRTSPEIVRSFPQLLSLRDLQELLRDAVGSEIVNRSRSAIALAQNYSRAFVPTNSYYVARDKLQKHGFVVLEGPPEMGKTTIGRVIALSQIVSGWDAIECRGPSDVLKMYRAEMRQVFVADDFFGRTEYEPIRVSDWQAELAHIIPLLDHSHWLILTCRAHLLKMAKSELDVSGQNHRFPSLGEVIVDAGDLKLGEKARILYRHAKSSVLTQAGKDVVRSYAILIVNDRHFTPERIRRLVEEILPTLVTEPVSEPDLKRGIIEALSDPTRQMRVTFRKLPICHRWLLFALLESDYISSISRSLGGSMQSLRTRYETLCPPKEQQPFERILSELTEAFVTNVQPFFTSGINWIHPSCRDLAIEELAQSPQDKHRFLTHCSETGLLLASSLAGGAEGERELPLLQTDNDWIDFCCQAKTLIAERANVLRVIWHNYEELKKQASERLNLQASAERLEAMIKGELINVTAQHIGEFSYSDDKSFRTFFEICQELEITPKIDLSDAWRESIEEAQKWLNNRWVIWQDDDVPGRFANFVQIIQEFYPTELQRTEIQEKLQLVLAALLERAGEENNSDYDKPKGEDEIVERADAFESVDKAFKSLSELPLWKETDAQSLTRTANHFAYEANSLREDLPSEPDSDESSSYERPSGEDMDIAELFRDL